MITIIRENKVYFICFTIALIVGGILLAIIEQGDCIRFFSENRSTFGDFFFKYFTKMGEHFLYLIAVIALLFIRYRYAILVPLIGVVVTIVAFISKDFFQHDRPTIFFKKINEFDQINTVEGVDLLIGQTSFPSGHTMSAFALYGLLAFIFKNKSWAGFALFITALLIGFSRIYLVQHFLKDIYLGAILGTFIALLIYYLQNLVPIQPKRWIDKYLFYPKDNNIA